MRELNIEEMDNVSGGNGLFYSDIAGQWFRLLDYLWENKDVYFDALIHYTAQYGGLYDPYAALRQGS